MRPLNMPMLRYYKIATSLITPLVPLWLELRSLKGKEEKGRMNERFGKSSYGRPKGTLLWIHAASVGEANSVLSLIYQLRKKFSSLNILLTTGTVTSAALMKQRLPEGVLHHYAPVDTPEATERFIRHWLPDVVWFVESELWPNLIDTAKRYYCLMALINARMSERSFYFWQKYPIAAKEILSSFRLCLAQSEQDAVRLRALGAPEVLTTGNLKYDTMALPCNEAALLTLKNATSNRTIWLAASTHPGEEEIIAAAHVRLKQQFPALLTIIVPRHPHRGEEVAKITEKHGTTALRSEKEAITPQTEFYVADTLGELGLFYRLSEIAFIGGSLVKHGGQNPLEPALLSCALISGPHVYNFQEVYKGLQEARAAIIVRDEESLAAQTHALITNSEMRSNVQARAKKFVEERSGSGQTIIDIFAPVFAQ